MVICCLAADHMKSFRSKKTPWSTTFFSQKNTFTTRGDNVKIPSYHTASSIVKTTFFSGDFHEPQTHPVFPCCWLCVLPAVWFNNCHLYIASFTTAITASWMVSWCDCIAPELSTQVDWLVLCLSLDNFVLYNPKILPFLCSVFQQSKFYPSQLEEIARLVHGYASRSCSLKVWR